MIKLSFAKPEVSLHSVLLTLIMMAVICGCAPNSPPGSGSQGEPGAVAFSLTWDGEASQSDPPFDTRLVTGNVCQDYRIEWIFGKAVDQWGEEHASEMWQCALRRGKFSGLPVGNYRIVIQGEVAGEIVWHGEANDIQVLEDQVTDAGQIRMAHLQDDVAPVVKEVVPADGAVDVPANSALTVTFDNAVVGQSIGPENLILTHVDGTGAEQMVDCTVHYEAGHHMAVLTPDAQLLEDTAYTATLAVDRGVVVEDLAGNPMQQAVQWTFTTFRPDLEGPAIEHRSPQHAEMDIAATAGVLIEFSEPLLPGTVSEANIYLQHHGAAVKSDLTYDAQFNRVTLKPLDDLQAGATYAVVVTTDVADLAGNGLAGDDAWSFVTRFPAWHLETVATRQAAASTAIALDYQDTPYVSFVSEIENRLTYSKRTGAGVWEARSLISGVMIPPYHDFVIGPDDAVRAVASDGIDSRLVVRYFGLDGGPVSLSIVETGIDCQGVSLALDETKRTHVLYYEGGSSRLKYEGPEPGAALEVIDSGAGQYPDLAVTPAGEAHVCYYDMTNGHLKYGVKAPGGAWTTVTVDQGQSVGEFGSIALDPAGRPHISYYDQSNSALKYAAKQPSGQWLIETVDSDGFVGNFTSIAVDALGLAHISYHDTNLGALKYAARTAIGTWHTEVVTNDSNAGVYTSILVDSQNHIHISHSEMTILGNVGYATTRPPD